MVYTNEEYNWGYIFRFRILHFCIRASMKGSNYRQRQSMSKCLFHATKGLDINRSFNRKKNVYYCRAANKFFFSWQDTCLTNFKFWLDKTKNYIDIVLGLYWTWLLIKMPKIICYIHTFIHALRNILYIQNSRFQ